MKKLLAAMCKGFTRVQRYPYPKSPCEYREWKDGYCRLHHPEEKKKRQRESMAKKEALYQNKNQRGKTL